MATYLYDRDSTDRIRVMIVRIVKLESSYKILKETGLLNGKLTQQPPLIISKGKVKRSLQEQAQLEFRSLINKQKDKGYRTLEDLVKLVVTDTPNFVVDDPMSYELIDSLLPTGKQYADGSRQLMLAKDPKTVKSKAGFNWNREWWVGRKLDGESLPSLNFVNSVNSEMRIPSQI